MLASSAKLGKCGEHLSSDGLRLRSDWLGSCRLLPRLSFDQPNLSMEAFWLLRSGSLVYSSHIDITVLFNENKLVVVERSWQELE